MGKIALCPALGCCTMTRMSESRDTPSLTITEAAQTYKVSRATLLRRHKADTLPRNDDGTFNVSDLEAAGYMRRDTDASLAPQDASDTSQDTSQVETLKGVIDTLQKQLEASSEEKMQLLRQLDQAQALLLQEQQNIQRLLPPAGESQEEAGRDRRGVRDKLRSWWQGS